MRDMKKCPDCAEMVLRDATKCRHCGHRFADALTPDQIAARDARDWRSRMFIGALGVIAVVALIVQYG